CIIDDEVCQEASRQEIIRRYYESLKKLADGTGSENEVFQLELLMKQARVSVSDRPVVSAALEREKEAGTPSAALELADGQVITGGTSDLLGASAAMLLNALKELAGIEHHTHVISPQSIAPIQHLKTEYLGSKNPRLHTDEVLIALSASAALNPVAKEALQQLPKLNGCQAHTSVILSPVDIRTLKSLGIQITMEPRYENKGLYH
ncbi:MAG: DUF1846 family protein, partial [Candidatus Limivivens sp.]|nr:DUF1846 family protein [Candidatus Limivivens sp.]